jgi:hypothetical protein
MTDLEIDEDLIEAAQDEAQRQGRTLSEQITHWAMLGRAIEQHSGYDHAKVELALDGKLETTGLTELEKTIWMELFTEKMGCPGPEEEAFFASLGDTSKKL